MAFTDQQKTDVAREIISRIFTNGNITAHSDLDQIKAAVGKIDDAMDATRNQVAAVHTTAKLKIALLNEAKAGAPSLTNQQAGIAMAYWALKEVGLL